jgi:stearoyl-CoA desaturase (delta-9 desaturase)
LLKGSCISSQILPAEVARRPRRLNYVPITAWCLVQAGAILAPFTFSWSGLVVCAILYLLAGFGITLGFHRLLTHRSFRTPKWLEYFFAVLGCLANQGGPLQWAAIHRVHHRHSDGDEDPHSPTHGWWWSHLFWWFPYVADLDEPVSYRRYVMDLARDPVHRWLDKYHYVPALILVPLLYLLGELWGGVGLSWVVWGLFVRVTMLLHATWLVNSAAHAWGYRSHATRDRSTNLWWVALLTLGEGWHNNHHAFPRSARHGLRWWEIDMTYWLIRLMSFVRLARQIHVPGKVLAQVNRS